VVGVSRRHGVVVRVEPHQREGSGPGQDFAAGIEGDFRQGQTNRLILELNLPSYRIEQARQTRKAAAANGKDNLG
jgi:hypothetical protein